MAQHITNTDELASFVRFTLDSRRTKPLVLLTTPDETSEPYAEVSRVEAELGATADVYVVATGHLTWALSDAMPHGTDCYAGACRTYPVGTTWTRNPSESPLRFQRNNDNDKLTQQVIADALDAAAASGAFAQNTASAHQMRKSRAVVEAVIAGRALARTTDGDVISLAPELIVPRVPADRLFAPGMSLEVRTGNGGFRIITLPLTDKDALRSYAEGATVIAKASTVTAKNFVALLTPTFGVTVTPAHMGWVDKGGAPESCTDYVSEGEVLTLLVESRGGSPREWTLVAADDDVRVLPAPSFLPGGPPWLEPEDAGVAAEESIDHAARGGVGQHSRESGPAQAPKPGPLPTKVAGTQVPSPGSIRPVPGPPGVPRASKVARPGGTRPPSPADVYAATKLPAAQKPERDPESEPFEPACEDDPELAPSTSELLQQVLSQLPDNDERFDQLSDLIDRLADASEAATTERTQLAHVTNQLEKMLTSVTKATRTSGDSEGLAVLLRDLQLERDNVSALIQEIGGLKTKLRKAQEQANKHQKMVRSLEKSVKKSGGSAEPLMVPEGTVYFADDEEQFRFEVYLSWVRRLTPDDKKGRVLPEIWLVGPDFLSSIVDTGASRSKVADRVADILLGGPHTFGWRKYTENRAGLVRERGDGAVSYRANLEQGTGAARRLHVWQHTDGTYELENVAHHDDHSHRS